MPQPIVVAVVDEFLESLQELTDLGLAGSGYVRSVLMEAVGESKAATVLAKSIQRHDLLGWRCLIGCPLESNSGHGRG